MILPNKIFQPSCNQFFCFNIRRRQYCHQKIELVRQLKTGTKFCQKLSEKTGKKYVLPTEAMWEYAARGVEHRTASMYSGSDNLDEVAWFYNNSLRHA